MSLTKWLAVVLVAAVVFATWSWLRPYEWRPDAGARFQIVGVEVTRDQSYHWVQVHLKRQGPLPHDLLKPVRLVLGSGRELEPADTRLLGTPEQGTTELWFKFWLEPGELAGPLRLRLNDGVLTVKKNTGEPALGIDGQQYFNSTHW